MIEVTFHEATPPPKKCLFPSSMIDAVNQHHQHTVTASRLPIPFWEQQRPVQPGPAACVSVSLIITSLSQLHRDLCRCQSPASYLTYGSASESILGNLPHSPVFVYQQGHNGCLSTERKGSKSVSDLKDTLTIFLLQKKEGMGI